MIQKAPLAASPPFSLSKERWIQKGIWADSIEVAELRCQSSSAIANGRSIDAHLEPKTRIC